MPVAAGMPGYEFAAAAPPLLDSGFRWNDAFGRRCDGDLLSYQDGKGSCTLLAGGPSPAGDESWRYIFLP